MICLAADEEFNYNFMLKYLLSLTYVIFFRNFHSLLYYRNEFYFCGFYRCVNSGESLINLVKPKGLYVKFVSYSLEFTY